MHWLLEWSGMCHPEVQTWFLVGNPWAVFAVCLGYFVAVAVTRYFMSKRDKPINVHYFSLVHNFLMVVLSLYMAVEIARQAYILGLHFVNNECDSTERGLALSRVIYIFYLSKIPEWIDTLIMILKKNERQVTFLHLYHHGSIFVYCWLGVRHIPGGDCYLAALLNSSVHVVMYSYYFMATLSRDLKKMQSKSPFIKLLKIVSGLVLRVKPFITIMQLVQFFVILGRDLVIVFYYGREYTIGPFYLVILDILYMISMVVLFLNFFIVNFIQKKLANRSEKPPKKVE